MTQNNPKIFYSQPLPNTAAPLRPTYNLIKTYFKISGAISLSNWFTKVSPLMSQQSMFLTKARFTNITNKRLQAEMHSVEMKIVTLGDILASKDFRTLRTASESENI